MKCTTLYSLSYYALNFQVEIASIQINKQGITNEEEIKLSLISKGKYIQKTGRIKRLCSLKAIQGKKEEKSTTLHVFIGGLIDSWDVHLSLFTSYLSLGMIAGGNRPASFPKTSLQDGLIFSCSLGQLRCAPHRSIILRVGGHQLFESYFKTEISAQLS
ncbi:hypothetical protein Dimus_037984 [Dionaea muscipula]